MTSLVRTFLPLMLCSVFAIGQMPVWVHVGGCDGHHSAATQVDVQAKSTGCSHCCHHHDAPSGGDPVVSGPQASESPASSDHQHDSHHCFLCQSLHAPVGVSTVDLTPVLAESSGEKAGFFHEKIDVATHRSAAAPRGPPV